MFALWCSRRTTTIPMTAARIRAAAVPPIRRRFFNLEG